MPVALGVQLLGWAQAQAPRFTFAASNYHPPSDQATIVQSPGIDEGEPSNMHLPEPLRPRPPPAGPQATHSGQLCTSCRSCTRHARTSTSFKRPKRPFCANGTRLYILHESMNIGSLYTSCIGHSTEACFLAIRRHDLVRNLLRFSVARFQGSEKAITGVRASGTA